MSQLVGLFKETFAARKVQVHFLGMWSVSIDSRYVFWCKLCRFRDTLSSTAGEHFKKQPPIPPDIVPAVCFFRHALGLDEVRTLFQPEYANGGATFTAAPAIQEVWFAGDHFHMYVTQLDVSHLVVEDIPHILGVASVGSLFSMLTPLIGCAGKQKWPGSEWTPRF